MTRIPAPLIDIVRMEDKESKLKAFISTIVEQNARSAESVVGNESVLLIARSVESPVAKAVAALVREGAIEGPVATILGMAPRDADQVACETLALLVRHTSGRLIRDHRLFDAHEQIVLGGSASWIGDCMRRDPMKRDAYECFAADCARTAGWARISHNRLWTACDMLPEIVFAPAIPMNVEAVPVTMTDPDAGDPFANPQG